MPSADDLHEDIQEGYKQYLPEPAAPAALPAAPAAASAAPRGPPGLVATAPPDDTVPGREWQFLMTVSELLIVQYVSIMHLGSDLLILFCRFAHAGCLECLSFPLLLPRRVWRPYHEGIMDRAWICIWVGCACVSCWQIFRLRLCSQGPAFQIVCVSWPEAILNLATFDEHGRKFALALVPAMQRHLAKQYLSQDVTGVCNELYVFEKCRQVLERVCK